MKKTIKGIFHLYIEQGIRSAWALQDVEFIRGIIWDFDGLIIVQTGDYIKALNPDNSIFWEGEVIYNEHLAPDCTKMRLTKHDWSSIFLNMMKGEITREVQGEVVNEPVKAGASS